MEFRGVSERAIPCGTAKAKAAPSRDRTYYGFILVSPLV